MCNLYSLTKGQQAIRELTKTLVDKTGNLPPLPKEGAHENLKGLPVPPLG